MLTSGAINFVWKAFTEDQSQDQIAKDLNHYTGNKMVYSILYAVGQGTAVQVFHLFLVCLYTKVASCQILPQELFWIVFTCSFPI